MIGCSVAASRFALRQNICEQVVAVGLRHFEFLRSLEQQH